MKSWQLRKIIVLITLSMIVITSTVFFTISMGYAYVDVTQEDSTDDDDDDTESDNGSSTTSISSDGIMEMLDQIFISQSGYTYGTSWKVSRITTIFNSNDLISSAYEVMEGLAVFAFFIACVVKAMQGALQVNATLESQLKFFLMALCGLMLINYSAEIFDVIYDLGLEMITDLRSLAYNSIETGSAASLESSPWLVKAVSRICFWVAKFMIVVPCWMLIFEACIRRIFLPFAAADLITEGWRSPGIRYLKSYLGIFINIGMAYVIAALMCVCLATLDSEGALVKFLSTIGIVIGGSRLMTKTQGMINEALGG